MGIHLAKIFIVLLKSSLFLLKKIRFYQNHGYSVEYTEYTLAPPLGGAGPGTGAGTGAGAGGVTVAGGAGGGGAGPSDGQWPKEGRTSRASTAATAAALNADEPEDIVDRTASFLAMLAN